MPLCIWVISISFCENPERYFNNTIFCHLGDTIPMMRKVGSVSDMLERRFKWEEKVKEQMKYEAVHSEVIEKTKFGIGTGLIADSWNGLEENN